MKSGRSRQTKVGALATAAALAILFSLVGPTTAPPTASTQDVALESFHGRWLLDSSAANRRSLAGGIDRVVDQLNLFIREIARGEIHRRITAEQRIDIYVTGEEQVALTFDSWGPHQYQLGSPAIRINNAEGNPVRSSARFENGRLIQRQVHTQGTRSNTMSLNGDADRLTMAVVIGAGQLPDDIRYRLTFSRAR